MMSMDVNRGLSSQEQAYSAEDLLAHVPFLKFNDDALEKEFPGYFYKCLGSPDVPWSIITVLMTIVWGKSGLQHGIDPWFIYPNLTVYLLVTALIVFLATQRLPVYIIYRNWIIILFRVYHQIVLYQLDANFSPTKLPVAPNPAPLKEDTVSGFLSEVFRQCTYAGAVSNGYQLLSKYHLISVALNVVHHIQNAGQTCGKHMIVARPLTSTQAIHSHVAGWIRYGIERALPLTISNKYSYSMTAPCHIVHCWTLLTFGFLVPYTVTVSLEEYFRHSFLKEKGRGVLSPTIAWRVAHALTCIFIGSIAIWGLLEIGGKMLILGPSMG